MNQGWFGPRKVKVAAGIFGLLMSLSSPVQAKDFQVSHSDLDFRMPRLDREFHQASERINELLERPFKYAVSKSVNISVKNRDHWKKIAPNKWLWRMKVDAAGASSLNFAFKNFKLPKGVKFLIYSADLTKFLGPYTSSANKSHGELWTSEMDSENAIMEIVATDDQRSKINFNLTKINRGIREKSSTRNQKSTWRRSAGSCNRDVVCKEGDAWKKESSSVARISIMGMHYCTGFLMNNTKKDKRPLFLTANHCNITATNSKSVVLNWNFQTKTCSAKDAPTISNVQSGATFLAGHSKSDFTLLLLDSAPKAEWQVRYAGWDRRGEDASRVVGIHHPSHDVKSISFSNIPTTITSYLSDDVPGNKTHIRIEKWDMGTTEGGSSGSPLFNQDKLVIGQLHGGYASCSSSTSDWYGRLSVSWKGGGKKENALKYWLDTNQVGDLSIESL
jgi:lysyl endopeptidase